MKISKLSVPKKFLAICLCTSILSTIQADDTSMIFGDQVRDSNILFLLDMSYSMTFRLDADVVATGAETSRLEVLRGAFTKVIGDKNLSSVNVGAATFGKSNLARGIAYPVSPIDDSSQSALGNASSYMPAPSANQTTREYLTTSFLTTWSTGSGTPIVDGLYESYLYFRGLNVDLGNFSPSNVNSAHPATYTGTPKKYKSPVTACSSNAIVMVTDGFPSINNVANKVQTIIGGSEDCASDTDVLPATGGYTAEGRCGVEFANYLGTHSITGTESDQQYLNIYTIGLALAGNSQVQIETRGYLDDIATSSGGKSYLAGDEDELIDSLTNILKAIPQARTFTSPSFTPDLSSMLTHDQYTYLAMFDRKSGPAWFGNLKKFKIVNGELVDKTDTLAFNSDGTLKNSAKDFWSVGNTTEEHPVKSGGAAQLLVDTTTRNLYSDIQGNNLTVSSNALLSSNLLITKSLLGDPLMDLSHRAELISYIRGNEKRPPGSLPGVVLPRKHLGDILHSKPVVINYGQDKVIFVGTNEGYLHAFRDDTGQELYAYMPSELLAHIETQYDKDPNASHVYGVDGPITVRHDDLNKNGIVDSGEKAILYFGLRRGGHAYYALDVSLKAEPKLLWKINNNDTGFANLGFTWSQPTLSRMTYTKNGSEHKNQPVLVFGGGYIDDNANEPEENTTASDVYIVNANTGDLIWKTPDTTVLHAVPGQINVLDMNSDGSIDRLYFADVGGFIWRVDFLTYNFDQISQQRIHKFADLGGAGISKRKFFVEPDVALFQRKGKFYISLAIGSGERPEPLKDDSDNHFFVLFDKDISLTSNPAMITINDLVDVTSTTASNVLSGSKKGWFLNLENMTGEKVFSKSLTYRNKVMFNTVGVETTTQSSRNADNSCDARSQTPSVFYALDLFTAGSVLNIGAGDTLARSTPLYGSGNIPGTPQIYYSGFHASSGGACTKTDCGRDEGINVQNQIISIGSTTALNKVFWRDKGR